MGLLVHSLPLSPSLHPTKGLAFYMEKYPDEAGHKVLGLLDYELLLTLGLDHIYTANYFYLSLGLLAASLMACTYTRQLPTVKVGLGASVLGGWGLVPRTLGPRGIAHSLHLCMLSASSEGGRMGLGSGIGRGFIKASSGFRPPIPEHLWTTA